MAMYLCCIYYGGALIENRENNELILEIEGTFSQLDYVHK